MIFDWILLNATVIEPVIAVIPTEIAGIVMMKLNGGGISRWWNGQSGKLGRVVKLSGGEISYQPINTSRN